MTNPIHNAIDALHEAFVGTPAESAGTPIDFAQDVPEDQPEPIMDPDSERESLTIEEAILRECFDGPVQVGAIVAKTGMKPEHIILAADASPFLVADGDATHLGLSLAFVQATEAGQARAAELGWTDAVGPDPEEGADAKAKAWIVRDDEECQRLLEEARLRDEGRQAEGEPLPSEPIPRGLSAFELMLLNRIDSLEARVDRLTKKLSKASKASKASAAKPNTDEGAVNIRDVQPGTFLQRGKVRRMLIHSNGSVRIAYLSPSKGWSIGYCNDWSGVPYTPSPEDREAVSALLSDSECADLNL